MRAPPRHRDRADVLRAAAFTVGAFVAVNLVGELVRPSFATLDAWVSLAAVRGASTLRTATTWALAASVSLAMITHALVPLRGPTLRFAAATPAGAAAFAALASIVVGPRALAAVPTALFFAAVAWQIARPEVARAFDRRRLVIALATSAFTVFAIPLVQIVFNGPIGERGSADCAVVLGARVLDDGRPSDALADRVDEGVALYNRGLAACLVMSGAVDPNNGFSEPVTMAARAVVRGVPAQAIVLDEAGVDTASTARNVARIYAERGLTSALVVTHYYHVPRTKMLLERAGVVAYGAPATMQTRLVKEPYFVLREIAAYYHSFLLE